MENQSSESKILTIATRASALARWQAEYVQHLLEAAHPNLRCEILICKTLADQHPNTPIQDFWTKGVFVKELEAALLSGKADIAVHSCKDLQARLPEGLVLEAFCPRAPVEDVLWTSTGLSLDQLPHSAHVGSSSPRRAMQILALRPDLKISPIRGIVQTRIEKVKSGEYDATILARAGLERLGIDIPKAGLLTLDQILPAAGQGAIAIECREADASVLEILDKINDQTTTQCVSLERQVVRELGAHCQAPLAVYAQLDQANQISLHVRAQNQSGDIISCKGTFEATGRNSGLESILKDLAAKGINAQTLGAA